MPRPKPQHRPTAPPERRAAPHPFLKWVGGKGQLLGQIWPFLPEKFEHYHEPFLGGGAMFFALRPRRASLSDVNAELVDCYQAVRDCVDDVIEALRTHRHDRDEFYRVRALDPAALPLAERAARTIYLNRTGYNGLYRVNRAGRFNVPFGDQVNPNFCDVPNLRACSRALQGVELSVRDFSASLRRAAEGDLVYLDPPYVPRSRSSAFTAYAAGGFGWDNQQKLARAFARLEGRGVRALLSNSNVPALRELYAGFRVETLRATRMINSVGTSRGAIDEVLVVGAPSGARQAPEAARVHKGAPTGTTRRSRPA